MKVVIEQKHTVNARYIDNRDCPLFRAIKEQHPEFPLKSVAGTWIRDTENNLYAFNNANWNSEVMKDLREGIVNPIEIEIENDPFKTPVVTFSEF